MNPSEPTREHVYPLNDLAGHACAASADPPDRHSFPEGEEARHIADHLCGCNPDAMSNETPESHMRGEPSEWVWVHHRLGPSETTPEPSGANPEPEAGGSR